MHKVRAFGTVLSRWLQRSSEKFVQVWQWAQQRTETWLWGVFGFLLIGAGTGSALFMFRRQIGTVLDPEILDFWQVAANVAAGKGLKTFVLRPIGLTPDFTPGPIPDLYHPPLPAILWGAAFALKGRPDERIAVLLAGVLIGIAAALLFFATMRLVNRWAALITAGLLLVAPITLSVGGMGQPASLVAALFTLWLVLLTRKAVWDKRFALISGILLGITGLSNGLTLLAAPFALASRRWISWRERIWFLAALLLVLLPYGWRNYRLTGIPLTPWKAYALLLNTNSFPSESIYRHAFESLPSPIALSVQNAGAIVRKGLTNLRRLDQFGSAFGWLVVLGAFTAPIWWLRWKGTFLRTVTAITLGTGASCLIVLLFSRPSSESLFFLLPTLCLLTGANMASVAERILATCWWQWLTKPLLNRPYWIWAVGRMLPAFALGVVLFAAQSMSGLIFMKKIVPIRWDPAIQTLPLAEGLMNAWKGEKLLASDEPRWLAIRWQRPVVWLPCHREDWQRLKLTEKVTHIWLSPGALMQIGGDADTSLRQTLLLGLPFLDRYYPTLLRAPRVLMPTPFLIAGKPQTNNRPKLDKSLETMSVDDLVKKALEHQQRKEYAQAERLLFAALMKQPQDSGKMGMIFFYLGGIWIERELYPLAIRALQAAWGETPGHFAVANNLAWSYLQHYERLSQLPQQPPFLGTLLVAAEQWAERALANCPPNPEIRSHVLDTAAWVDFLQGRTKAGRGQDRWRLRRALRRLEEAYRLAPDNKLIREHLAAVYTELGMSEKAERLLSAK